MLSKKIYLWQGINASGEKINHMTEAKHIHDLKNILISKNITLLTQKSISISVLKKRIRPKHIDAFLYRFCFLIKAKVSIVDSLTLLLLSQTKIEMTWLIQKIKTTIEKGESLSKTLAKLPEFFNATVCALITVSEHSSHLHLTLEKILMQRKKMRGFQQQIKKAMIYPTTVLLTAIIVCILLLNFVVPNFEKIYTSFHVQLPLLTRVMLHLSNNLHHHFFSLLFSIILLISSIAVSKRYLIFKVFLESILRKTPYLKTLIQIHTLHYWCYSLAETINAGLPLLHALSLAEKSIPYFFYRKKFQKVSASLRKGNLLHHALKKTKTFPKDMVGLIQIAEQTGNLNEILNEIARQYHIKLNDCYEQLNKLIEPVITLFVALITGTLVIALYWPIFNLGELF